MARTDTGKSETLGVAGRSVSRARPKINETTGRIGWLDDPGYLRRAVSEAHTLSHLAVSLSPDISNNHAMHAAALYDAGCFALALISCEHALDLSSENELALYIRARALVEQDKFVAGPANLRDNSAIVESNKGEYTSDMDATIDLNAVAAELKIPPKDAERFLRVAATELIGRELKARLDLARKTRAGAPAEPRPETVAPRTAQELFGVSATTPARRYHKSEGPEFSETELADRVLLSAAHALRNDMQKRTQSLTPEERETWRRAGRFVYRARKHQGLLHR